MSQSKDFLTQHSEGYKELRRMGLRGGPEYADNESAPLVWYDQVFEREIEPAGSVQCAKSLAVGGTQNGLDVILVASHQNTEDLTIPAGTSITLKTLFSENPEGPFAPIGPSWCVTAPEEGINCPPDGLAVRFAIGNYKKLWMKISLEFSGSISGGTVDAALSYVAR
ncbi:MAG: hypothetical protein HDQ93_05650 [Desulfovibrio sp.]|nr:hypothetical protein [Desulfovibrio sp.]